MVEVVNLGETQTTFRLQVTFAVNATFAAEYPNVTWYKGFQADRDAALQALVDAYENSMKSDWPEWLEKDAGRSAAFTITGGPRPDPATPDAVEYFDLAISWPVQATARIEVTAETDAVPYSPEFAAWAQAVGAAEAANWISSRSLTSLE